MNWKEMKEFCNKLNEQQLDQKVFLWMEESIVDDIRLEELSEDYYIDKNLEEEGCMTLKVAEDTVNSSDHYESVEKDFMIAYKKGTPVMWDNY